MTSSSEFEPAEQAVAPRSAPRSPSTPAADAPHSSTPEQREPGTRPGRAPVWTRWTVMGVVGMLVGALVVLTGLTAAAAVGSRLQVEASTGRLQTRWAPAHVAAVAIRQAYTDQAAGHLGFMITGGGSDLRRYQIGQLDAARAETELRRLLPDDPMVPTLLAELESAAQQWRTRAVDAQIAARRVGSILSATLVDGIGMSSSLYDVVRTRIRAIDAHTHALENTEVERIVDEQRGANIITAVAVAVAAFVAVLGVLLLRRALGRPSRTLLLDVNTVAAGDYGHPIARSGPLEYAAVADAVHRMRVSILRYGEQLAETQHRLTRADEQERVGAELRDRTIRRVFALGLTLTSTAARFPELAAALRPLIEETDNIVGELRRVIVGLNRDQPPATDRQS